MELFHSEAAEYLQLLNDSLLALEKAEDDAEAREHLDEMFRAAHSLKGMSATMGYHAIAQLTHRMEDLLDRVRQGDMEMSHFIADLLFEGLDALERMLSNPEAAEADEDLVERYTALLQGGAAPGAAASAPGAAPSTPGAAPSATGAAPSASGVSEAAPGGASGFAPGTGPGEGAGPAQAAQLEARGLEAAMDGFEPTWRLHVAFAPAAPMKSVRGHIVLRALDEQGDHITVMGYRPDPLTDADEAFEEGMEITIRTDVPIEEVEALLLNIPDVVRVRPTRVDEGGRRAPYGEPSAAASAPDAAAEAPTAPSPAGASSAEATGHGGERAPAAVAAAQAESAAAQQTAVATAEARPKDRQGAASKGAAAAAQGGRGRAAQQPLIQPDRIVRVDTEQLDALVNLVGELVIYRVRLMEVSAAARHENAALQETVEHIDRITDNLQHAVMSLRMVPVSQVFNRFPRVVRDISRSLGKQVDFSTEGDETELDRSIVHQLGDPLVHLIRNALDHGLEPPEERIAAGKPPIGQLRLRARHEGNHVIIEVSDDGRGIDPDRIARVAVKRGVITPEELDVMTEAQKLNLLFHPGFSTAEKVTDVSGRGVGMDAVRTAMESLNGQVEIHSRVGEGTTVTLRLPLTLAIIPAMLVRCGTEISALPLEYVMHNLRLRPEQIYTIQGFPHFRWQDNIVPVRSLAELLKIPPERLVDEGSRRNGRASAGAASLGNGAANGSSPAAANGTGNGTAFAEGGAGIDGADARAAEPVPRENGTKAAGSPGHRSEEGRPAVIIDVGSRQAVLEVDEILGQQEVVIKNLGALIGEVKGVAGATVLGSGRVALILDLPALLA